jgi:hypothetical protein
LSGEKFIIVKNGTKNPVRAVRIEELHKMIPADGKFYKLPYEIAYKYREALIPVKIIVENADYAGYTVTSDESIVNEKIPLSEIMTPEKKPVKKATKKRKTAKKKKPVAKKPITTPVESAQ